MVRKAAARTQRQGDHVDKATTEADRGTTAVVLCGAIARGAFQAGALAEIVPALETSGRAPTIFLGTSAGSINAVLWGAMAHEGAREAARHVVEVWKSMGEDDVYRSLPTSAPLALAHFVAGLSGRGSGPVSVFDTAPLRATAKRVLDTAQLASNVDEGVITAVGAVATRVPAKAEDGVPGAGSGRSILFLDETRPSGYTGNARHALDVVHGPLSADHVLASSAFPMAFPPTRVCEPAAAAGWYIDGGVRLNAPLHPAIDLGADRIVVISATATERRPRALPDPDSPSPSMADTLTQVLGAVLGDRMIEDLTALRRTNALLRQATRTSDNGLHLTSPDGRRYRPIEILTVSPPPGAMGQLAEQVFHTKTRGLGRLTQFDNWLLGQVLRGVGDGPGRRELLSYLFFDPDYFTKAIEFGRTTAVHALAHGWTH
jgi:NTE family protein